MTAPLNMLIRVSKGRLDPSQAQKDAIAAYLGSVKGEMVSLRIAPPKKVRSVQANKFLWGVVYKSISQHTGYTTEEVHDLCRNEFLPRKFIKIGTKEHQQRKSTAELSVAEFQEYLSRVEAWAGAELGIAMPLEV